MVLYYEKLCLPGLSLFLVWIHFSFPFFLVNLSLGLGFTDVRRLVVLRGVGLEEGGLLTETCGPYPIHYLPTGR